MNSSEKEAVKSKHILKPWQLTVIEDCIFKINCKCLLNKKAVLNQRTVSGGRKTAKIKVQLKVHFIALQTLLPLFLAFSVFMIRVLKYIVKHFPNFLLFFLFNFLKLNLVLIISIRLISL